MITKQEIEAAASKLSDARAQLEKALAKASHALKQVGKKWNATIEPLREAVVDAHDDLHLMVAASPGLFDKPKSMHAHGIAFGFRKDKDFIAKEIPVEDVLTLIKRTLPAKKHDLIVTRESLAMHAAENLSDSELEQIGMRRVKGEDAPFVKAQNASVETMYGSIFGHSVHLKEGN